MGNRMELKDSKEAKEDFAERFLGNPNVTRARAYHLAHLTKCLRKVCKGEVKDENLLESLEELPITRAHAYHAYATIQSLRKTVAAYRESYGHVRGR